MTKKNKNTKFKWNVWTWSFNHDALETYDVVPILLGEYKRLKKNEKPKTLEEFSEFMNGEASYHFWSKCEWEMITTGWPTQKNSEKVDVYDQLMLNWDVFIEAFWKSINEKTVKATHRKQRGRTAPNRALKNPFALENPFTSKNGDGNDD